LGGCGAFASLDRLLHRLHVYQNELSRDAFFNQLAQWRQSDLDIGGVISCGVAGFDVGICATRAAREVGALDSSKPI
jgi:hypothetical protein